MAGSGSLSTLATFREYIEPMQTVGVIREDRARKVRELAVPMGVVGAIIPTTNPTSTAIYKILISMKARCPIVISPHPSAVRCITRSAEIMSDVADSSLGLLLRTRSGRHRNASAETGVESARRKRAFSR